MESSLPWRQLELFMDPRVGSQQPPDLSGKFSGLFRESFAIPFAISSVFICLQTCHALVSFVYHLYTLSSPQSQAQDTRRDPNSSQTNFKAWTQTRIADLGGFSIFTFAIARLLGCLVLLALSLRTLVACDYVGGRGSLCTSFAKCPEVYITLSFAYSSFLAVISLTVKTWSTLTTRYNILLLLSIFLTYAYRDIWPLATYYDRPVDITEGGVLWLKIGITFFTAIIIPLFIPRRYIPVVAKVGTGESHRKIPRPPLLKTFIHHSNWGPLLIRQCHQSSFRSVTGLTLLVIDCPLLHPFQAHYSLLIVIYYCCS